MLLHETLDGDTCHEAVKITTISHFHIGKYETYLCREFGLPTYESLTS